MVTADEARCLAQLLDDINEAQGQQDFSIALADGVSLDVYDAAGDHLASIGFNDGDAVLTAISE